jgi:outer membrane protein TolC
MRSRNILATVLLLTGPGSAGAEPLSRAQAVSLALNVHPEVRKIREGLASLQGRKQEALADALPELTVLGSANRFRDPSLLNSSSFDAFPEDLRAALTPVAANLFEGTAQLRQTLFSFKLGHTVKAARYGLSWGQEEVRRVEHAVALDTLRTYNGYLLNLEKVRVTEKAVRQKEKHLEMAQNRRAAGVATDLDVLRSQVDTENLRVQLERARGEADGSRGALNAALLRPIPSAVEPTDTLAHEPLAVELEDVVREALATRPEVKGAALNERVYDELIGVARAESRPRLDFSAFWGYSVRKPENFFERNFTRWAGGITLTVPVFDGWRTAGKVAQARADRNRATQDRVALENQVRLEAQLAVDRLRTAERVIKAADLNVSQAQKAADMTQANYQHGAATTLDVLDAQAALTLAESLRVEALYEHANARATVRYVMGRDLLDPSQPKAGDE